MKISLYIKIITYLNFLYLKIVGYVKDMLLNSKVDHPNFAALYNGYESFYIRHVFVPMKDLFGRALYSPPTSIIKIKDKNNLKDVINIGSYNYLGFDLKDVSSAKQFLKGGSSTCSSRQEIGTAKTQIEMENLMAGFLGVESCIAFGMGFATNALNIPCLVSEHSLILSDTLNHTSIVLGSRISEANIKPFKHNDMKDLEEKLLEAICSKRYNKILIIVEGIYSMEGDITNLPKIIELKKKYKAYLYVDEAHSIGALGKHGRGITEYHNCDPNDVDILMGTFTKSFSSAGGYIAGKKDLIDYIKQHSIACCYAISMSYPVCKQIKDVLITLQKSNKRMKRLHDNTVYFRNALIKNKVTPVGDQDSPVVPVMLYYPHKIASFNRRMLKDNIGVVTVGYPATELHGGRVRFCISALHTKEMLDYIVSCTKKNL